jgi:ubiquinone/menaquinone biosynthesis C-methylase UbiE
LGAAGTTASSSSTSAGTERADVYPYEGLTEENLVEDITRFPFDDASFDSVTFIASISHVPEPLRDIEKKSFLTQWGLNHLFVGWKR